MTDPGVVGPFEAEVRRVRDSGALGEAGRLLELFDFLAARGPTAPPASQAEIAETVFGQTETNADDATVRVYIHRLRKRLDECYADADTAPGQPRLTVPAGTYALRLRRDAPAGAAEPEMAREPDRSRRWWLVPALAGLLLLAFAGMFLLGRSVSPGASASANAIWQPFFESERPRLLVVGDYYIYGEIDPVRPEEGRLIRDFRVNSRADLERMQDVEPQRYGGAEDIGLNYLPFSAAYGLRDIMPILARDGREVRVLAASEFRPDMLNHFDVVYVGLLSGLGLLEDITFMGSAFDIGESYDELIDTRTGTIFTSEEARRLASPAFYRDYGYVTRFRAPGGALVAIVAGARDTGLRGLAPIVAGASLPRELDDVADSDGFEALFQITGQQGADLSERLIHARERR